MDGESYGHAITYDARGSDLPQEFAQILIVSIMLTVLQYFQGATGGTPRQLNLLVALERLHGYH